MFLCRRCGGEKLKRHPITNKGKFWFFFFWQHKKRMPFAIHWNPPSLRWRLTKCLCFASSTMAKKVLRLLHTLLSTTSNNTDFFYIFKAKRFFFFFRFNNFLSCLLSWKFIESMTGLFTRSSSIFIYNCVFMTIFMMGFAKIIGMSFSGIRLLNLNYARSVTSDFK